ncbi:MAG: T9SS type A sorting domain-containing protein [Saprospiraceae bacterium]|nr:T9SS type A sorting domain-containing protein [Saprospiraceae bacterium]
MKKVFRYITIVALIFQMYNIYGQNQICVPDSLYRDSIAGIYPRPYNDSTKTGGINKAACIDQDYEFPLTVRIPDMITIPIAGSNVTLGLENAFLDTVNAVTGLPIGIKYYCNPGSCNMKKNVLGCVILKGKPTTANKPGIYDLIINLKLITSFGTFDVAFPGPFFPGKYSLTLAEKTSSACLTSDIHQSLTFDGEIKAYPIPAGQNINFTVFALRPGTSSLWIRDITGRQISSQSLSLVQGENKIVVPVHQLGNGVYTYTLRQGVLATTKRFIVLH